MLGISKVRAKSVVLTISCPDRRGIVATVSKFLFENGCNILDSAQFGEAATGQFFLRINFHCDTGARISVLQNKFRKLAETYSMNASFHDATRKLRTVIMVSKFGHCLVDLLYRHRIGALPVEIPLIVSNHADYKDLARAHGIPFCYLPVTPKNKLAQEEKLLKILQHEKIDLLVLARYMQVLSNKICARYPGRIINIHHSFLPSFKGARPYQQAHERGVKLIGATAHYVTPDLDEGPIIEQGVERVSHAHSPEDYAAIGRDVESVVLARAVKWHAEHRILLSDKRTIVFN